MKRIYFFLAVAILIALWLGHVDADKTVVIKNLTGADFTAIKVIVDPKGIMQMCGTYQLKDSAGVAVGNQKFYCKALTAAQKTTLITFVRDDVLLIVGANAQEGM